MLLGRLWGFLLHLCPVHLLFCFALRNVHAHGTGVESDGLQGPFQHKLFYDFKMRMAWLAGAGFSIHKLIYFAHSSLLRGY